jgi:predicted DNA-binding protein (UPF0251 family)
MMPTSDTHTQSANPGDKKTQPRPPERIRLDPATLTFGYVEHLFCWGNAQFASLLWEIPAISESIQELNRYAYSKLGQRLIEAKDGSERSETFEAARRLVADRWGFGPTDVDCLPFDEAVKVLCSGSFAESAPERKKAPEDSSAVAPDNRSPSGTSLAELIDLLDEFDSYPPPPPPGSRFGVTEYRHVIEMGIFSGALQDRINGIDGISQLRLACYQEQGQELDASYVRRIMANLAFRRGLTLDQVKILTVSQAVERVLPPRGSETAPVLTTTPQPKPDGMGKREIEPTPEMFRAFLAAELDVTQREIANQLGVSQSTVHRHIQHVKKWRAAGNKVPALEELPRPNPRPRTFPVDPRKMARCTEDDGIDGEVDE